jgi:hypothetical protein
MRDQPYDGLNLFSPSGKRKYLNAAERQRFVEAARRAPSKIRLFCLTLRWSGARISEVLRSRRPRSTLRAVLPASKLLSAENVELFGKSRCRWTSSTS